MTFSQGRFNFSPTWHLFRLFRLCRLCGKLWGISHVGLLLFGRKNSDFRLGSTERHAVRSICPMQAGKLLTSLLQHKFCPKSNLIPMKCTPYYNPCTHFTTRLFTFPSPIHAFQAVTSVPVPTPRPLGHGSLGEKLRLQETGHLPARFNARLWDYHRRSDMSLSSGIHALWWPLPFSLVSELLRRVGCQEHSISFARLWSYTKLLRSCLSWNRLPAFSTIPWPSVLCPEFGRSIADWGWF